MNKRRISGLAAIALLVATGACKGEAGSGESRSEHGMVVKPVTVTTADGKSHMFKAEVAATEAQQQQGLMYRPPLAPDAGMLFAPYPPDGGPPRAASFWMRNTPGSLDIIFIRQDGTIATIGENAVPFSDAKVDSGEPIAAVLELGGGRTAELGIAAGDKVTWK
ncbi:DUF192 domain-containing protein [Sphingomonas sp. 2R-10]|uniref:DUF192 domain-containing protein n=1 Tax=Sphingomonas sp. 2R-10 TaxID=3045148 RepID=UPI000F7B634A|nr:DUF192 domain-containing protein [Sphingomonas sp. 2R-10]MDJ0275740.1 DUF192 domain-containing protein [Sphingomonas sp. 2R-10]